MIQSVNESQNAPEDVKDRGELKRIKLYKQMLRLESSFNPDATQVVEQFEQGREILLDQANVVLFTGSAINEEPSTFSQAWNHEDPKVKENWRVAISKEFDEMNKKKVWKLSRRKISQRVEELLSTNGSLRSRGMESSEQDYLLVVIVKFLELTLMKALLHLSTMLVFESC
jgi:hypothetical protein